MAGLTQFQRDAVELVSAEADVPTAVLRYSEESGPELLLQNGWADEDDPDPQFDLLAVYVAHLAQRADVTVEDVYDEVDERVRSWNDADVAVESERRESGE